MGYSYNNGMKPLSDKSNICISCGSIMTEFSSHYGSCFPSFFIPGNFSWVLGIKFFLDIVFLKILLYLIMGHSYLKIFLLLSSLSFRVCYAVSGP